MNSISDPARVEILKGPQNAYFGRNAFAGAVNVVNKTPKNDFGGSMNASVFSRDGYDVQGSLEGPIVRDLLSFRISGRALERDGSYRNRANPNERLGDQRTRTITGMLLFTPSSQLTVKLFGLYSRDNDGASAQGMLSAYEVRSNNGIPNIPALSGNT
ncbi:MAG: TonB-dependent receptor, partial [Novosphingobium sp.]